MASYVELVAVVIIAIFAVGVLFGVVLIVAAGIKAEENVARSRNRARQQRATTLYDEPSSTMTRGVRRLTGAGHDSRR
jgi:hypothetical protein